MRSLVLILAFLALLSSPVRSTECHRDRWTKVATTGPRPTNINGHTMVDYLGHLFVFGGLWDSFINATNTFYKTLWKFNSLTDSWSIQDTGTGPSERAFHGAAVSPLTADMFVYGGITYNGDFSNITIYGDFWRWDFFGHNWASVTLFPGSPNPGPRADFGMTSVGGQLYMFGGIRNEFFTDTNELWRFNPLTRIWTLLKAESTDGSSPSPRHAVEFVASEFQHKIYLYGGEITAEGFAIASDTWVYNVLTNTWTDITPSDPHNIEPPRFYSGTALIGRKLALYGGDSPGGIDGCGAPFPQNPQNDTWEFDTITKVWTRLFPIVSPPRLKRLAGASIGTCFFIHGGFDFPECQVWNNDLWTLRVNAFVARGADEEGSAQEEENVLDDGPRVMPKVRHWPGRHPLLDVIARRRAELGL